MKNIFKNFTTGKLKIFSAACSALMLLQAACVPTYATYNTLMRRLVSTRYATVSDIEEIIEENPSFVDDTDGDENIIDYVLYEGENDPENRAEIAKYLIQHGAPVTCSDPRHSNSYRWGCENGLFDFCSWLLRNGWDFDYRDNGRETVAHVAAIHDRANDLEYIMKKAPYLLNDRVTGGTPLGLAALFGKYSAAEWLVNHGADLGSGYSSALETAKRKGYKDIVALIEKHTKPKAESKSSKYGNTALHTAVLNGNEVAVRKLLASGADVNAVNTNDRTPLHLAAKIGNATIVDMLIRNGANIEAGDFNGNTPLHLAAGEGKTQALNKLLENGADLNSTNNDGYTPLHLATMESNFECIKSLLDKNADPNIKGGKKGSSTALDYCYDSQIKALLVSHGAVHGKGLVSRAFGKLKLIF